MYKGKTLAVILPTYAERDSIGGVIRDFFATGVVDEVIVVDNNSQTGTRENVGGTGARLVAEPRQGFGYAVTKGFRSADAGLIAVCEPDGTFAAQDIFRLLAHADRTDLVLGSRTNAAFIAEDANMGFFLRCGNILTGKILSTLFSGPGFTDVGCTMRLIQSRALRKILPQFRVNGSAFNMEMTVLALQNGLSVTEVPLTYKKRVGRSFGSGNWLNCFSIALQMYFVMLKYRLKPGLPGKNRG
ncbi:MAG TPA: glycosyltransferase family 2 protein [Elusimicrobiales bacterium]|nr:glycosyltransferase family 2 protein [Elusimicrobiales bacterium]